jgi:hypothetical protein
MALAGLMGLLLLLQVPLGVQRWGLWQRLLVRLSLKM